MKSICILHLIQHFAFFPREVLLLRWITSPLGANLFCPERETDVTNMKSTHDKGEKRDKHVTNIVFFVY